MNWSDITNQILNNTKDSAIAFWHSPWPYRILNIANIIAALFSLWLIVGIVIVLMKSSAFLKEEWLMKFKGIDVTSLDPGKIRRKWKIIEKRLKSQQESNYKIALIEADKLLDNLLERAGYLGRSLGERLERLTTAQLSNLEDIWKAHKLRNTIVHDIEAKISFHDIKQAISAIKKALDELEAL